MKALPKLIAITTGTGFPADRARALTAVRAGVPGLLLREPLLSDRELLSFAEDLREASSALWLVVHDRAHLANSELFDGVHLGFRSLKPSLVSELIGSGKVVGFSSHASDEAEDWSGADYVFFSPVKETPSKSGLLEPTGFDGLQRAASERELPVFALGGLEPCDVQACLVAGASGVACLSDILLAEDPERRVALWLAALTSESELNR